MLRVYTPILVVGIFLILAGGSDHWWSDYGEEALPAVNALLAGDVQGFLDLSPTYGASLLMRAPLIVVADGVGIGEEGVFRVGALMAILVLAVVAAHLMRSLAGAGGRRRDLWLTAIVFVSGPLAIRALDWGHPEELMASGFAVAGVVLAARGRALLAGLALGLAIASKQWAVIAVLPAAAALPSGAVKLVCVAGFVGAALMLPFLLSGTGFLAEQHDVATSSGSIFRAHQVFWPLGDDAPTTAVPLGRRAPQWLVPLPRPLIVLISVPAAWWFLRRRRGGRVAAEDALLLMAGLAMARCALDPWNIDYYHLPMVLFLAAWEVLARRRPPILALVASVVVWLFFNSGLPPYGDGVYLLYMVAVALLSAYIARNLSGVWMPRRSRPRRTSPGQPGLVRPSGAA